MNFQNDRPDPHGPEEAKDRILWLVNGAGRELWLQWEAADFKSNERMIDFLRHIATTCRRTANYLEKQNLQ